MIRKTIRLNRYGNVDIRRGVPKTLEHYGSDRTFPFKIRTICRKLRVPYADALIDFEKFGGRWFPRFDGVVVPCFFATDIDCELYKRSEKRERRMARQMI